MKKNKIIGPISKSPLVVNLLGGPGSSKSTSAALLFSILKRKDINAELVTEFAKSAAWENNVKAIENQAYIFGRQCYEISRCADEVDVIITDSPLLLSIIYNHDKRLTENFNLSVMDVFNSYNNLNIFLKRPEKYNPKGRFHTSNEAKILDNEILDVLEERKIPYIQITPNDDGYQFIIDLIINKLKEIKTNI